MRLWRNGIGVLVLACSRGQQGGARAAQRFRTHSLIKAVKTKRRGLKDSGGATIGSRLVMRHFFFWFLS